MVILKKILIFKKIFTVKMNWYYNKINSKIITFLQWRLQ